MAECLTIHPTHPQPRLITQVVECLHAGGVIVYPTDSGYALGCEIGQKDAAERIRRIRQLEKHHNFTLVCRDLSELSSYARVDNPAFRRLKAHTPGPYTFVLKATKEVPRRLQNPKCKTVGLRVPDHALTQAILTALDAPIMSVSLLFPELDYPYYEMEWLQDRLAQSVDLIVDAGPCPTKPTSVIDLSEGAPVVLREGAGDISSFV